MLNASTPREISEAFATVRQQRAGALDVGGDPFGSYVPILLKKSLMISGSSDSVAVMRFAVEAGDDGAARSRSRAAVLFILS